MTLPPAITEADLHAYVDGQLPQSQRGEVEAYLAARSEEAERVAAYRRQNEELRALFGAVLDEPVPERLLAGLKPRGFARRVPNALAAGLMLLGFALGTLAGWQLHALRGADGPSNAGFVRNAALAHAVYSPEVRHPVEVGADQEAHLVAWLSKRLGASVRVPRLDANGFSLVGGRLLPGDTGPVAQFMYQTPGGRRLTLYVRTEPAGNRETAFRFALEGDVRVFYWIDHSFGYALSSSDLNRDELLAVANAAYKQLNP